MQVGQEMAKKRQRDGGKKANTDLTDTMGQSFYLLLIINKRQQQQQMEIIYKL